MRKKYKIIMICNDTAEYDNVYIDIIDKTFNNKRTALRVLKQCMLDEVQELNENSSDDVLYEYTNDNKIWYLLDFRGVYTPQYWLTQYHIIEI